MATYTPAQMAAAILAIPKGGGGGLEIIVSAASGGSVSAEKDSITYPGSEDELIPGRYEISIPEEGSYTVTFDQGGMKQTKTISIINSVGFEYSYELLDYLESYGGAYIDTELVLGSEDKYEVKMAAVSTGSQNSMFGSSNSGGWNTSAGYYNDGLLYAQYWVTGDRTGTIAAKPGDTDFHVYMAENYSQRIDDDVIGNAGSSSGGEGISFFLFGRNVNGSLESSGREKTAYSKIWENGVLASEMYPVRRNDGVLGMFDVVRSRFFTNAGSGNFIAGPEVS